MNNFIDKPSAHAHRDQVAQVYFGMLQWGATGEILRRRIDWMADHAEGPSILDVGCSEGVLEILLARKGFNVTGVDVNAEVIEFAQTLLAREAKEVQKRVRFIHSDLTQAHLPNDRFDTLVMGEILEHLEDPKSLLDRSLDLLRPEGRVIVTTPFGYHPHEDHRQTFCLSNFMMLLRPRCKVEHLQVEDGYIRMVAQLLNSPDENTPRRLNSKHLLNITELALVSSQKRLHRTIDQQKSRVELLVGKMEKKDNEKARLREDYEKNIMKSNELRVAYAQNRMEAKALQREVDAAREREVQLERSIRWQLGTLLVDAAQRPWRTIRLPLDVVRLSLAAYRRRHSKSLSGASFRTATLPTQLLRPSQRNAGPVAAPSSSPVATATAVFSDALQLSNKPMPEWIIDQVVAGEVAVLGTHDSSLLGLLEKSGCEVSLHEFDPAQEESVQPRLQRPNAFQKGSSVNLQESDRALEAEVSFGSPTAADTAIIWGMLQAGAKPEAILCRVRDQLSRPQSKLIVVHPTFEACPENNGEAPWITLLAALRATTVPEYLSFANNQFRFVGRFGRPNMEAWSQFEADIWPRLMNEALKSSRSGQHQEIRALRQRVRDLLDSTTYRAGQILVESAKEPRIMWRIPVRLLRLYRSSRGRTRPRTATHAPMKSEPPVRLPRLTLPPPPRTGTPTVAAILDAFTEYSLRYEADLLLVTPKGWKQQLERSKPAFLLVESAWRGNNGAWRHALTHYTARRANPLRDMLRYCRDQGTPTVFWNKEDPPNFDVFLDVAQEFDFIFTTDADCIPKYRDLCSHERVYVMPFACQPRLHNPCHEQSWPKHSVCFAGSWMEKYPDRKKSLDELLTPALAFGLHIFDRNYDLPEYNSRYRFPDRYQNAIKGSLDYESMLTAYRCYNVMLNVNTVSDSPTMFSRRVFESLACGTPVISTDSVGVREMLGEHTRIARSSQDTTAHLNELLNDEERRMREGHLGYRYVHEHHTYKHRMNDMFVKVGLTSSRSIQQPSVTVVIATCRPENVRQAVANFGRQCYETKELLLVLNNATFDLNAVRTLVQDVEHVHVLEVQGTRTLGECLNRGVDASSGDYITKMDIDGHYGKRYLADVMLAARYSEADILGKGTYFVHVESKNVTALRCVKPAHQFTTLVAGGTLTAPCEILKRFPFPDQTGGEDTSILANASEAGCRIYSADPFNFLAIRRADTNSRTWKLEDEVFLKLCRNEQEGVNLERVMI